jgi:hypothetical protein
MHLAAYNLGYLYKEALSASEEAQSASEEAQAAVEKAVADIEARENAEDAKADADKLTQQRSLPGYNRAYGVGEGMFPTPAEVFTVTPRNRQEFEKVYDERITPAAGARLERLHRGMPLYDRLLRHYMGRKGGYFPRAKEVEHLGKPVVSMLDNIQADINAGVIGRNRSKEENEARWREHEQRAQGAEIGKADLTHSAPISSQQLDQMAEALPPDHSIRALSPKRVNRSRYMPQEKRLYVPGEGASGLPVAMHEYAHVSDPVLQKDPREIMASGYNIGEAELPATVVERATEASPYLPPERRRPFTTQYGKQIDKFGPRMEGNFPRDLHHIQNWMKGLRGVPGAQVEQRRPFAYNRDKRTPQQRAKALGSSYKNWMNWQARRADNAAKPGDAPNPVQDGDGGSKGTP